MENFLFENINFDRNDIILRKILLLSIKSNFMATEIQLRNVVAFLPHLLKTKVAMSLIT